MFLLSNARRRILHSLVAGNISSILLQIASVPILLKNWGPQLFGEWLLLITIPGYLAISDLGVVTVANNRIDRLIALNRTLRANNVFATSNAILTAFFVSFAIILSGLAIVFDNIISTNFFRIISDTDLIVTCLLLAFDSYISLSLNHNASLFRSISQYSRSINLQTANRTIPSMALLLGSTLTQSTVIAAALMLFTRMVLATFSFYLIYISIPWLEKKHFRICKRTQRILIKLASSFILLPASNAIYLQATSTLIGFQFGAAYLAVFNTLRTFTRLIPQFVSILGRSLWAEISSKGKAASRNADFAQISRHLTWNSIIAIAIAFVLYILFGEIIFERWTRSALKFDLPLFIALLANACAIAFYTSLEVILIASNTHRRYAIRFFTLMLGQIAFGYLFSIEFGAISYPVFGTIGALLVSANLLTIINRHPQP